jgi:predicted ATPase
MEWKIRVANYRCFSDEHPFEIDLSNPITALVGPNNSGKSAALRFFWEIGHAVGSWPSAIIAPKESDFAYFGMQHRFLTTHASMYNQFNDQPIRISMEHRPQKLPPEGLFAKRHMPLKVLIEIKRNDINPYVKIMHLNNYITAKSTDFNIKSNEEFTFITDNDSEIGYYYRNRDNFSFPSTYGFQQPTFVPSIRSPTNISIPESFELSLGSAAIQQWDAHKGSDEPSARDYTLQVERELARVFDYDHIDINTNASKQDFIVRINGDKSFLMREMGSGFGQLFSVIFNLINRGNPLTIFDEPEIGLHPKLQRELLRIVSKYSRGSIIFATHSLGLAKCVANEILLFKQNNGSTVCEKMRDDGNIIEMLGEMSFSAWRELGCDGILFVEGVNDVRVFSEWIRLLDLGASWVVLPLGGAATIDSENADAIQQVVKLHNRIAIIIDSERKTFDDNIGQKRKRFYDNCKNLEIPCHLTNFRATENYFSDAAVKSSIGDHARSLQPYEKITGECGWGKSEGARIAAKMTREELASSDVGQFLIGLRLRGEDKK